MNKLSGRVWAPRSAEAVSELLGGQRPGDLLALQFAVAARVGAQARGV